LGLSLEDSSGLHEEAVTFRGGIWHACIGLLLLALSRLESADVALKLAHEVWGEEIPIAAASLANVVGTLERAALVEAALVFANSAGDIAERALVVCLVMPCLDPEASRGAGRLLADLAVGLAGADVMKLLRRVNIQNLPDHAVLSLVQRVLRSELTRRSLLEMLVDMIPALRRLGGESLVWALPDTIGEAIACAPPRVMNDGASDDVGALSAHCSRPAQYSFRK
jgi:hypothetical protein